MQRKNYFKVKCQQTQDIQNRIIADLDHAPDALIRRWTEFEEVVMRKYVLKKGAKAVAKALGRTINAVVAKRRAMNLVPGGEQ